tara:strand:- start:1658 stop:2149 length:492 start_codon:yes stop_codon:yes gene_type:complete
VKLTMVKITGAHIMKRGFRNLAINLFVCAVVAVALIPSAAEFGAQAQDSQQRKLGAAREYWKITGFSTMMDDTIVELANNYPAEIREEFIYLMRRAVNHDAIEEIGIDGVAGVFTLAEIEALAEFYDSELGQSVLKKMPKFLAVIQPAIQAEVLRSLAEITNE